MPAALHVAPSDCPQFDDSGGRHLAEQWAWRQKKPQNKTNLPKWLYFASDLNQEPWHLSHRAERDYRASVSHLRALQPRISHLKAKPDDVTNLCLRWMSQCSHPAKKSEPSWCRRSPAAPAQPQVSEPAAPAAVWGSAANPQNSHLEHILHVYLRTNNLGF